MNTPARPFFPIWGLSVSLAALLLLGPAFSLSAGEAQAPIPESWSYAEAMKMVAKGFKGTEGVVIHVGDSVTLANGYSYWARKGTGKTAADIAILKWMHTGKMDKTDGWWLCSHDVAFEVSYTAVGGMQCDHLLAGGRRDLPSLKKLLEMYQPQMVVLLVGGFDAASKRPLPNYRDNMTKAVDLILAHHAIPILNTITPFKDREKITASYSEALRDLAKTKQIPLLDMEKEVLKRRPNDWNGTLINKDKIHFSSGPNGGPPTAENLNKCGYLLRGWLTVQKVAEVKRTVLDPLK